jgi:AcrR family transcriptional regulator
VTAGSTKKKYRNEAYHHGNLPIALIEIAKKLIAERGAENFTLREAARQAGVSHVATYRHYADRRALLAAVAEHGFEQLRKRLQGALNRSPASLEPRLRAVLAAYLRFCWDEPELAAVMFGPRLSNKREFPQLEAAAFETLGIIENVIATLAPAGALEEHTARQLGLALWTFVHGFSTVAHAKRAYPSSRKAAAAFDDMLTPTLVGMFGKAAVSRRKPQTS